MSFSNVSYAFDMGMNNCSMFSPHVTWNHQYISFCLLLLMLHISYLSLKSSFQLVEFKLFPEISHLKLNQGGNVRKMQTSCSNTLCFKIRQNQPFLHWRLCPLSVHSPAIFCLLVLILLYVSFFSHNMPCCSNNSFPYQFTYPQ